MEYKSVPKPLETKIDLITSIDKPAKSSCRRYGLKICYGILLLVVLIYCMYLHYSYLQVSGKFEELQNSKSKAGKAILKTKSLDRRHVRERQISKRQLRNDIDVLDHKVSNLLSMPLVHLTGGNESAHHTTGSYVSEGGKTVCDNSNCFLWNPTSHDCFDFLSLNSHPGKVVGVEIKRSGVYEIYSQLCIAGLTNEYQLPQIPSFGFQIVRLRHGSVKTLTEAFLTQDERGQSYVFSNGNTVHPVDTLYQKGYFELWCNDVIVVRLASQLEIGNYNILQDNRRAYFGLRMITSTNLNDTC